MPHNVRAKCAKEGLASDKYLAIPFDDEMPAAPESQAQMRNVKFMWVGDVKFMWVGDGCQRLYPKQHSPSGALPSKMGQLQYAHHRMKKTD
jgi:hypothetical protein